MRVWPLGHVGGRWPKILFYFIFIFLKKKRVKVSIFTTNHLISSKQLAQFYKLDLDT
jgi:hypothetical protein